MTPSTLSQQNQKAARNGKIGEHFASIVYDTEIAQGALIDGEYYGLPLEVKTTQVWVYDAHNSQGRRRGRFYLTKEQHKFLLETGGYYCFVLLDESGDVIFSRLRLASDVDLPPSSRQLVWTRIFEEFE